MIEAQRRRRRSAAGPPDDDAVRAALVDAAERQLVASPDGDIATRAVCEEAGVTQPVLYRLFGDKRGLLDAVADAGFQRYSRRKAELERTTDPIADLYAGWDDHMAFAAGNPALYRLMFAPRPRSEATTHRRILELLEATLVRCAAAGALTTSPALAAQLILPANVGVALSVIARPDLFDDPTLSDRARDAVFAAVLTETRPERESAPPPERESAPPPERESAPAAERESAPAAELIRAAARRLRSQLTLDGTDALEPAETALLDRWLERIDQPGRIFPIRTTEVIQSTKD